MTRGPYLALLLVVACSSLDSPAAQRDRGSAIYEQECRHCHDVADAIGVKLTSRTLASYGNAQRLFNYTQLAMPYQAPRTLAEQEYWDVVAYLVSRFSLAADTAIVNGSTAESLTF